MCPVPFASSICLLTTGGSALFPQKVWCMRCSEPAQTLPWLTQGSVSGSEQRTLCRRSARCAQYPSLQVFVCSQLVVLRCFHRRCGIFAWRENRDPPPLVSTTGRRTHGEMFPILWRNWSGCGWKGPWLWQVSALSRGGFFFGCGDNFPIERVKMLRCLEFCFEPSESIETTATRVPGPQPQTLVTYGRVKISLYSTQRRAKRWPMLIHHFTTYFQCFVLPLNSCSFCKPHAR